MQTSKPQPSEIETLRDLVEQVRTTVIGAPPLYHIYREELHQQLFDLGVSVGQWWDQHHHIYTQRCSIGDGALICTLSNELFRFVPLKVPMPAPWQSSEIAIYDIFDRITTICSKLDTICHIIGHPSISNLCQPD